MCVLVFRRFDSCFGSLAFIIDKWELCFCKHAHNQKYMWYPTWIEVYLLIRRRLSYNIDPEGIGLGLMFVLESIFPCGNLSTQRKSTCSLVVPGYPYLNYFSEDDDNDVCKSVICNKRNYYIVLPQPVVQFQYDLCDVLPDDVRVFSFLLSLAQCVWSL
jgi:hypothetical protein